MLSNVHNAAKLFSESMARYGKLMEVLWLEVTKPTKPTSVQFQELSTKSLHFPPQVILPCFP